MIKVAVNHGNELGLIVWSKHGRKHRQDAEHEARRDRQRERRIPSQRRRGKSHAPVEELGCRFCDITAFESEKCFLGLADVTQTLRAARDVCFHGPTLARVEFTEHVKLGKIANMPFKHQPSPGNLAACVMRPRGGF